MLCEKTGATLKVLPMNNDGELVVDALTVYCQKKQIGFC